VYDPDRSLIHSPDLSRLEFEAAHLVIGGEAIGAETIRRPPRHPMTEVASGCNQVLV
jgi:hypothetical protein